MTSLRRSVVWSFMRTYANVLVQTVSTLILARLLTPEEIGVYSIGASCIAIAHAFRDFGVSTYIIQEVELTKARLQTAFALTLTLAWIMGAVMFGLSPMIADFYGHAEVGNVLGLLAVSIALLPFSSVTHALLSRDMRFGALLVIGTCAALVQATTGVLLAWLGFGAMSLAWGTLAAAVTTVLVSFCFRPDALVLIPSLKEVRRVLNVSLKNTFASIAGELGTAAPDLIVGRLLGIEAVGYLSRALAVVRIFGLVLGRALNQVSLPAFSRLHREGKPALDAFLVATGYITALSWPFFLFVSVWAQEITDLLLGDQWRASVPLMRILCLSGALASVLQFIRALLVSTGHSGRFALLHAIAQPILVILVLGAALIDLTAVAYALVVFNFVYVLLGLNLARAPFGLRYTAVVHACARSLGVAVLSNVAPGAIYVLGVPASMPQWSALIIAGLTLGANWLLTVFVLRHPVRLEVTRIAGFLLTHARRISRKPRD